MSDAPLIKGNTGDWQIVIGLEVHAQITSKAKLFSGAATQFGAKPNHQVSLVDAAMPGMLPVINGHCVEQAVRTGLALGAEINLVSVFDRKNYFYPDLPQGYQISQFTRPIVGRGDVEIDMPDGSVRIVGITRLHMEQDAGKSLHDQHPSKTYIDLNRAGVALMEIVSEPDIRSSEEAAAYLRKVRAILRYIGSCDGNMEEGSLRCDANVSMCRPGDEYGTRCEIKNLNSIRFLQRAIDHEAMRQIQILEDGGTIDQETRLYDSQRDETRSMRSKEESHDYRYFPDPDLLPLELDSAWVEELRVALPELPDVRKKRFTKTYSTLDKKVGYGLSAYNASVLTTEKEIADFYENMLAVIGEKSPKFIPRVSVECANLVITDLFSQLNRSGKTISDSPVRPEQLAQLQLLKMDGTISGRMAKQVFEEMFETGKDAEAIVEEKGLRQVSDTGAIEVEIDRILEANADKVAEYRAGKEKLLGFFVGQVMKATQGKANPKIVNEILVPKLKG